MIFTVGLICNNLWPWIMAVRVERYQ